MHEPTRFGGFLLLKKLSEDPLGETYRAGRIVEGAVAELVLLRTYGLAGSSSELVEVLREEAAAGRRRIRGPSLVYPLSGGEVGGVPYAVYEYSTGWSLLHLIEATRAGFAHLERDHGLLVVERLAKGLALVHQADPAAGRNHHGFVVPQNVRLSAEGEIGLMGFELGPTFARLASSGRISEVHPFLSPEVRSGAVPTPADDVYSLGAVLWQLLIGQPPPLETASGVAASLAAARMSNNEVLPAGLGELLQSSLAPRRVRFPDANHWHRKLSEWMGRNEVKTTHFDLAFFIHEVFRNSVRREEEEIERERRLDMSPPPEPGGPEISDIILRPDLSGMVQRPPLAAQMSDATPAAGPEPERSPGRSKAPLLALAAVLLAAVAGGWYWLGRGRAPESAPPPVQAPPPRRPAPSPAPPSDELQIAQGELERLVQERARGLSDQIAAEYDEQIRSLREQLRAAQKAEAQAALEASRRAEPTAGSGGDGAAARPGPADAAVEERPGRPAEGPAVAASKTSPEAPEPAPEPPPPEAAATVAEVPPPSAPPPSAPPPVPSSVLPSSTPPPSEPAPAAPPPSAPARPRETAAAPSPSPREAVKPPRRLRMPEARYPERARQYRKEATVLVKVLVDTDGTVIDAQPVLKEADTFGFFQEAVRAARGAEFTPAESGGLPVRMWTTVVITFKLTN